MLARRSWTYLWMGKICQNQSRAKHYLRRSAAHRKDQKRDRIGVWMADSVNSVKKKFHASRTSSVEVVETETGKTHDDVTIWLFALFQVQHSASPHKRTMGQIDQQLCHQTNIPNNDDNYIYHQQIQGLRNYHYSFICSPEKEWILSTLTIFCGSLFHSSIIVLAKLWLYTVVTIM